MSVLIRCPEDPSEWGIIELQGVVIPKMSPTLDGESLGYLEIKNNIPVLVIGNHILRGKIETLKKPLLVIRKDAKPDEEGIGQWESVAFVRKKYLFVEKPQHKSLS
eukprot:TRINITY_DN166_c1_g1_i1.p1 TRINITY_DN166_c1_g1~~TRINITY_DN166_c1_g1_i1.p1  ORF type:complete len:106 (-),score=18.10 TRINITY_DN166_c1_g1_i1:239-556(-)